MPIVNAFDEPQGGANGGFTPGDSGGGGGGGGGGVSLDAVPLEHADLTDTSKWTLFDPDNLVKSVSFDASTKQNLVTFNSGAGSANYRWNSGTTIRAPRWYSPLTVNSVRFTESTFFTVFIRASTVIGTFDSQTVVTTCTNPTATTNSTSDSAVQCYGVFINNDVSFDDREGGPISRNSSSGNFGDVPNFHCTYMRGGGGVGPISFLGYNASNVPISGKQQCRSTSEYNLPGSDLFWMIGIGTMNSSSVSEDEVTTIKAEYVAIGVEV